MGHQKWFLIKNSDCEDFKDKIQKTKEAVLDVLGKSAGTHFHKKFLLKKDVQADSSVVPLDLSKINQDCCEEIHISETFIDYTTAEGDVISCSVEKKGSKRSFAYTHKCTILKNGQKVLKKKNISAAEYLQYKSNIKKDHKVLRSKRVCIIDNGMYIIVDYFPESDGQPLLAIIQVKGSN